MDKGIVKKWWFWLGLVAILVVIGAATQSGSETNSISISDNTQTPSPNNVGTLPILKATDYNGKAGLITYKELKSKGYTVTAEFEKQALTDINGHAGSVFEPLDPNSVSDRQSVDAFVVGSLVQSGDSIMLSIVLSSN